MPTFLLLTQTNLSSPLPTMAIRRTHFQGYPYIYLRPAGDLKASPGELAKLVQFLLRRGKTGDAQILKQESIIRMESVESTLAAKNGLRLGYGLANYTQVVGGVVTHGHDGGIDGFISSYRYMPEQNWGYVVLLNSTTSFQALLDLNRLAIDFLSKDFPKTQQPPAPIPAAELEKFAGYYAPRAPRAQLFAFMDDLKGGLRIRVINGQLTHSSLFGKPEVMIPVGKNLFRSEKDPEATVIFVTDSTGKMVFSGQESDGISYGERTTILWPYARLALLVLCVILMATSVLFAIVWVLRKLFGGMKDVQHLAVRAIPLLATLSFFALALCFTKLQLGHRKIHSVECRVFHTEPSLSAAFAHRAASRRSRSEKRNQQRHPYSLSARRSGLLRGHLFVASWHFIGLRIWTP